jgi:aminomethyltransferase
VDGEWILARHAQHPDRAAVAVEVLSDRYGILALQGPASAAIADSVLGPATGTGLLLSGLKRNQVAAFPFAGTSLWAARTGYTGEDGFEVLVPADQTVRVWERLVEAGVKPAGLGARDTLRLEAGMNLYGQDMDEDVSPYEAGLAWTVAMDEGRDFIGRGALEAQLAAGNARQMVGLVMDEKGVLRHGQKVLTSAGDGEILTGTFSPSIGKAIALARVPAGELGDVRVDIRGREVPVRIVKYPFVREGAVLV